MELVKRDDLEYWSDEFGNLWLEKNYTKGNAEYLSTHLNGCRNCINCIGCHNCIRCTMRDNMYGYEGANWACVEEHGGDKRVLEQFKIKYRAKVRRITKKWHKKRRRILKAS